MGQTPAIGQTRHIEETPSPAPLGNPAIGKTPASSKTGTIGPNAVTQLTSVLLDAGVDQLCAQIFATAGVTQWLVTPPTTMIPQEPVARLHQALRAAGPTPDTTALLTEAGRRTADYLLTNRIPRPVQRLLKHLPASLAARVLVAAIRAHAWTFAGSGRFVARNGSPTIFEITHNPLCASEHASEPVCAWHAAVFQRLFQALVSPETLVIETACEAQGDPGCRFVIDLSNAERQR